MGAISDCCVVSLELGSHILINKRLRQTETQKEKKRERCLFQDHGKHWPLQHKRIPLRCRAVGDDVKRSLSGSGMK